MDGVSQTSNIKTSPPPRLRITMPCILHVLTLHTYSIHMRCDSFDENVQKSIQFFRVRISYHGMGREWNESIEWPFSEYIMPSESVNHARIFISIKSFEQNGHYRNSPGSKMIIIEVLMDELGYCRSSVLYDSNELNSKRFVSQSVRFIF